ncbi:Na+/H+ antiporter NhaA, partial [Mycobacterium tuberculosis]|nr:Na+/H+ antiporter NhaA [Mycobacterium tuberculosis]
MDMTKKRPASVLRDFLDSEAAGGIILMFIAALAMAVANSPVAENYFHLIHAVTGPVLTPKL